MNTERYNSSIHGGNNTQIAAPCGGKGGGNMQYKRNRSGNAEGYITYGQRGRRGNRAVKPMVFVGIFIVLTLLFTMYQASVNELGVGVLNTLNVPNQDVITLNNTIAEAGNKTLLDGKTVVNELSKSKKGNLLSSGDAESTDSSGTYTISDTGYKIAISKGKVYFYATAYITSNGNGQTQKLEAKSGNATKSATATSGTLKTEAVAVPSDQTQITLTLTATAKGEWGKKTHTAKVGPAKLYIYTTDDSEPKSSITNNAWTTNSSVTLTDSDTGIKSWSYVYYATESSSGDKYPESSYTTFQEKATVSFSKGYGKYVVTATDNVNNSATYTIYYYSPTVDVSCTAGGTVYLDSSTTLQKKYAHGNPYTIKAVPDVGYYFAGWEGSDEKAGETITPTANDSTSNLTFSKTLTIGEPKDYTKKITWTATFKQIVYTNPEDNPTYHKDKTYQVTAENGTDVKGGTITAESANSAHYGGAYGLYAVLKSGDIIVGQTATFTITINPLKITITPTITTTKVYDGNTDVAVTWATSPTDGVDSGLTYNIYYEYDDKNVGTGNARIILSGATTAPKVTNSDALAASYTVTLSAPDALEGAITQRPVTVSIACAGKVYDGNNRAENVVYTLSGVTGNALSGVVSGDNPNPSGTATYGGTDVGEYLVTATEIKLDDGNYCVANADKTATVDGVNITPKPIEYDEKLAVKADKVYDGGTAHTFATLGTITGCIGGESITVKSATATFDNKKVGTNKTVYVTDITLAPGENTILTNYSWNGTRIAKDGVIADETRTANITKRPIGITITIKDKQYDGTNIIGADNVTIEDDIPEETKEYEDYALKISFETPSYTGMKKGTYNINVNVSIAGADVGNYYLKGNDDETPSQRTYTVSASITPKELTVSGFAVESSKTYDGTAVAKITNYGTISGFVGNDSITVDEEKTNATYEDKNVGTDKTVTVTFVINAAEGTNKDNYIIPSPGGITANITARPVTVSIACEGKVYDGTANATVTYSFGKDEVISGDDLTVTGTATYAGTDVGTHIVTAKDLTLGGTDAQNYSISNSQNQATVASISITKFEITVTANAASKTYGTADPEFTCTVSDKPKAGVDVGTFGATRDSGESVGEYTIKPDSISGQSNNYSYTYVTGTFTINKLKVLVNVKPDMEFSYGSVVNLATSTTNLVFDPQLAEGEEFRTGFAFTVPTEKYPGFEISGTIVGTYTPTLKENPTDHPSYEYVIAEKINAVTIVPKELTVTYKDETITYGEAPAFTFVYSGLVGDETENNAFGTLPTLSVATNARGYVNAGTYTHTNENEDFLITLTEGVLAPNDNSTETEKLYNYSVTYKIGTLTVDKRKLEAYYAGFGVDDEGNRMYSTTYSGREYDLTVYYVGFVSGEDENNLDQTNLTQAKYNNDTKIGPAADTYAVKVYPGSDSNYGITDGKSGSAINATIGKKAVTVTYAGEKFTYTGTAPQPTEDYITYDGFIEGESETTEGVMKSLAQLSNSQKDVGSYSITPYGAEAQNYTFNYVAGTLEITAAPLTVTYNDETITYGEAPKFTFVYSGLVEKEKASDAFGTLPTLSVATNARGYVNAGTYTHTNENKDFLITLTEGALAPNDNSTETEKLYNYSVTYEIGTLTVNQATLTVGIQNRTYTYGDNKQDGFGVELIYGGFVGGESVATEGVFATAPSVYMRSESGEYGKNIGKLDTYIEVGTYDVKPDDGVAQNYNFKYTEGKITFVQKTVEVIYGTIVGEDVVTGETVTYNGKVPQPNQDYIVYKGFVSGETADVIFKDGYTAAKVNPNLGTNVNVRYDETGALTGNSLYPSGATAKNYKFNYVSGVLRIAPATVTVTYESETITYGDAPKFALTYVGYIETETVDNVFTVMPSVTATKNVKGYVDVGTYTGAANDDYAIILTEGTLALNSYNVSNYSVKYVLGTLTVNKRALTIKFEDETLSYGNVYTQAEKLTFPWTPIYEGFVYGEDDSALSVAPCVDLPKDYEEKGAYRVAKVGEHTVTPYGGEALNYAIEYISGTLTIQQRKITVTYVSEEFSYGGDPAYSIVYDGIATEIGDTEEEVLNKSGVTLQGKPDKNERDKVNAGKYTLKPSGLELNSNNYYVDDSSYISGTLTVNKVKVTFYLVNTDIYYTDIPTTQDDISVDYLTPDLAPEDGEAKEYNTEDKKFYLVFDGFVNDEDWNVLQTKPTISINDLSGKNVGNYSVAPYYPEGAEETNYIVVTRVTENNLNVFSARFDTNGITFEGVTFTYDGEWHSIYVENIPNAADKAGADAPTTDSKAPQIIANYIGNEQREVGKYLVNVYFTHNVVGYSRIKTTLSAYITIEPKDIDYTVSKSSLTAVYGEKDNVLTGTPSDLGTGDKVEDLNVSIAIAGYDTAYRTAGGYKITASYENANYNVTFKVDDGSILTENEYTVTARQATVTLKNGEATYNGSIAPVIPQDAYTAENVMYGDELGVSIEIGALSEGEKYVVGKEYALSGTASNTNYVVTFNTDAVFTLTKADLTLTLLNQAHTYDNREAELSQNEYAFGEGELKEGDSLVPVLKYVNADEKHIHTVCDAYGALSGYPITATLEDPNYNITIVDALMIVNKRSAVLTLLPQEATYGDQVVLDSSKYETENVIEGDDLGVTITRDGRNNAGTYALYATTTNPDYNVTVKSGVFTIHKRAITLDVSKMDGITYVYSPKGVYVRPDAEHYVTHNNTDKGDLTVGINYPEEPLTVAGEHTVTVSIAEDANNLGASAEITVNVERADVTIDVSKILATTYVYNGKEQIITGATTDNTDEDATVVYSDNSFTDRPESGKLEVRIVSPETTNYNKAETTIQVTIEQATLNFREYSFLSYGVTYNGEYHQIEATGVPSEVQVVYSWNDETSDEPFEFRDKGTYKIKVDFKYAESNYRKTNVGTEATLNIYAASVTIEADDLSGQYGDEVKFTNENYKIVSGTVYGEDDLNVTISTEKEIRNIGTYSLKATASNPNYDITVLEGSYTITKREVTVKLNDVTVSYGDAETPVSYEVTKGSILDADADRLKLALSSERESGKNVGTYAINGEIDDSLYSVTVESGVYTITARRITVTVDSQTGTSASDIVDSMFTVEGGISAGDSLDIRVVGDNIGTEPGDYALTVTYTENKNYEVVVVKGTFTLVLSAVIKLGSEYYRKVYDGTPVVADVSINSGATLVFAIDKTKVQNSFTEVGSYTVTVSADAVKGYSAPKSVTFVVEICPSRLSREVDGIIFVADNADGFDPYDQLIVERNDSSALPNDNIMQQLDCAYTFSIEHDGLAYSMEEYSDMTGAEIVFKVKPTEELKASKNFSSYVVDANGSKITDDSAETDDEGYITLNASNGAQVYFVSDRTNIMPIIIAVGGFILLASVIIIFLIFRRKA